MKCRFCNTVCIKNGFQLNGTQRYLCKSCNKSGQLRYKYNAYKKDTNANIFKLVVNSCGINDISRVLSISKTTVLNRILKFGAKIQRPHFSEYNQIYEADEISIKVKNYVTFFVSYIINRKSKQVIAYTIGNRTQKNLSKVILPVLSLSPKHIYTDGLITYPGIIPRIIHKVSKIGLNTIERMHLTLRTHLKCLSRKTICYTRNIKTLEAILKLYFWGSEKQIKLIS